MHRFHQQRPTTLVRITAHAPYEATKHVVENLRCNLCNAVFAALLPEQVLQDGPANQQYGYSARALMSLHKFFSGQGYHHQGNLSDLMGQQLQRVIFWEMIRETEYLNSNPKSAPIETVREPVLARESTPVV